ncbi:MAG: class I SAM-dependent methyltransferase [Dehalococcoidia bacterium]
MNQPDPAVIEQKIGAAYGAMGGLLAAAMLYVGDELGLYKQMNGSGVFTSEDLARKSGLAERFVREWLFQQAASGVIEHRGDTSFEMLPEAGLVFADEQFPLGMSSVLKYLPKFFNDALTSGEAFRTGIGRTYDSFGEDGAREIDAMFGGWNRSSLVGDALPKVQGVVERLAAGGAVADVGCGAGTAAIAIGKAFPKAQIHGYDNSKQALKVAAENLKAAGISNVTFHNPDDDPLPSTPTFDLVTTLDCLHDMARPDIVASAIRKSMKPDGAWFIVDMDAAPTAAENLANPMAPMLFAASVMMCLQSSASTPDGLGLGTVGLPEPEMRRLTAQAGFGRFARVPGLEHPMNAYYEVRI